MKFRRHRREAIHTELTPLIDVVFLLLIFFAVSTSFVTTQGIQVDLPRSSAQQNISEDSTLRVTLNAQGQIYLDDRPVDMQGLAGHFARATQGGEAPVVVIKADRNVPHGLVVKVMDLAQRSGLRRLSVATDPQGR